MAIPFIASALAFSRFLPAVSVVIGLFLILIGDLLMSNYFWEAGRPGLPL